MDRQSEGWERTHLAFRWGRAPLARYRIRRRSGGTPSAPDAGETPALPACPLLRPGDFEAGLIGRLVRWIFSGRLLLRDRIPDRRLGEQNFRDDELCAARD